MTPDPLFTVMFGTIELLSYRWITDERGRSGQQYLRIDRDRHGVETSREVLEPLAWITWE